MNLAETIKDKRLPFLVVHEILSYIELVSSSITRNPDRSVFGIFEYDRKSLIRPIFCSLHINEEEYELWRKKLYWKTILHLRMWHNLPEEFKFPIPLDRRNTKLSSFEVTCDNFSDLHIKGLFHFCRWTLRRLYIRNSTELSYTSLKKYIPLFTKLQNLKLINIKKLKARPYGLDFNFLLLNRTLRTLSLDLVLEKTCRVRKMRNLQYFKLLKSKLHTQLFKDLSFLDRVIHVLKLESCEIEVGDTNLSTIFNDFEILRSLSFDNSVFDDPQKAQSQFDSVVPRNDHPLEELNLSRNSQLKCFLFVKKFVNLSTLRLESCERLTFSQFDEIVKSLSRLKVVDIENNGKVLIHLDDKPDEYNAKVLSGSFL